MDQVLAAIELLENDYGYSRFSFWVFMTVQIVAGNTVISAFYPEYGVGCSFVYWGYLVALVLAEAYLRKKGIRGPSILDFDRPRRSVNPK